ncbi:MAG TPA: class II SORL domain-containing protein [Planctomycetota bacterium]|nr:class II SORL domain-containing protein [Planctomycetota bacterium]
MPQAVATDLLFQINAVADPENMTDLEKKHDPVIICPDSVKTNQPFDCTVHVGKHMAHPNEPAHHIEFIDLYLDDIYLCRTDFAGKKSDPKVTFSIMLPKSGKLTAYENCNIHGVWASEKQIDVK